MSDDDKPAYTGPPRSDKPTATCPRCGTVAVSMEHRSERIKVDPHHAASVMSCNHCRKGTVVVERGEFKTLQSDNLRAPGITRFTVAESVLWWPTPGASVEIDPDAALPEKALEAYDEGLRCLAVRAPNAGAGRFRTALAVIANHKGGEPVQKERQLSKKLAALYAAQPFLTGIEEHAETIKLIGDAGTHQEDWPSISMEQADFARQLTRHLIQVLYEFPAQMKRSKPIKINQEAQ